MWASLLIVQLEEQQLDSVHFLQSASHLPGSIGGLPYPLYSYEEQLLGTFFSLPLTYQVA
jgi:hypothetical protein